MSNQPKQPKRPNTTSKGGKVPQKDKPQKQLTSNHRKVKSPKK